MEAVRASLGANDGHGLRQFAARPRDIVRDHPAPPQVLRDYRVLALPEEQRDEGRANLFAPSQ